MSELQAIKAALAQLPGGLPIPPSRRFDDLVDVRIRALLTLFDEGRIVDPVRIIPPEGSPRKP